MNTASRIKSPKTVQLNIKVEPDLLASADQLAQQLPAAKPDMRAGLVTRATVLRLALQRGIDELKREVIAAQPVPSAARKRAQKG